MKSWEVWKRQFWIQLQLWADKLFLSETFNCVMQTLTAWRWKQQHEGNKTTNKRRLRVWEDLGRRSWNESSHSMLLNAVWHVEHGTFCHPAERWASVYFQSLSVHQVSKCALSPVSRHTSCNVSVQTFPAFQSVLTQPTFTYSSYTHGHTQAAFRHLWPNPWGVTCGCQEIKFVHVERFWPHIRISVSCENPGQRNWKVFVLANRNTGRKKQHAGKELSPKNLCSTRDCAEKKVVIVQNQLTLWAWQMKVAEF